MNRGKLVIFTILGLALALAGFSVWYLHRQSRRAVEFWGSDVFQQICHAPRVEVLRLKPAEGTEAGTEVIQGQRYAIEDSRDLSEVPGRILLRESLAKDDSFVWDGSPPPPGNWQFLLRFGDAKHATADIAVSIQRGVAGDARRGTAISMTPIADGLKKFFDDQFQRADHDSIRP